MKFLPLVWKNLWRRKVRTIFTLACIFIAFLLFGLLMTIRAAFSFGVEIAGVDRLIIIHKVSLIQPLPVNYKARLATVPGVRAVTHNTWFGGIYQDPSNFFAQDRAGAGRLFPDVPGVQAASRADAGLAGGPARGRGGAGRGGAIRVEDRGPHSHPGDDLAAEVGNRRHMAVQPRGHLRRRRRRGHAPTSSSGTTTSTRIGRVEQASSAGMW